MTSHSIERREFLRRATLAAGAVGGLSSLAGCGGDPTRPASGPPAPSGFDARAVTAQRVDLSWTQQEDVTGFELERMPAAGGAFQRIAELPGDVRAFEDTETAGSTAYRYRIRALRNDLASPWSSEVSVQTPSAGAPDAPRDLAGTELTAASVRLTWSDASDNETGFRVYSREGEATVLLGETEPGTSSLFVDGLESGRIYRIFVQAFNDEGVSGESNTLTLFTGAAGVIESVSASSTAGTFAVAWSLSQAVPGDTLMRVERALEDGAFEVVAEALVGSPFGTTFTEASVPQASVIRYRLSPVGLLALPSSEAAIKDGALATYYFSGALAVLRTVTKAVLVSLPFNPSEFTGRCAGTSQVHLVRVSEGEVRAVLANCTHNCCFTNYIPNRTQPDRSYFACPCHGSQFRLDGSIQRGPATEREAVFVTTLLDDGVELFRPAAGAS